MGSITDLTIAGYPLFETNSTVIPEIMTVFRETDKRVFTRKVSERNELVWGKAETGADDTPETAIQYACAKGKVVDRLNVMGFTLRRVREAFEGVRKLRLE